MGDGHERLDAVGPQLPEHALVEGQTFLVGLLLVASREDARPGDGHAIAREAHLGQEGNVLTPVVVEVHPDLGRVVVALLKLQHPSLAAPHGTPLRPMGHHVNVCEPATTLVVAALALVGGGGAAPQESFWEWHGSSLFTLFAPHVPTVSKSLSTLLPFHVFRARELDTVSLLTGVYSTF